MEPTVKLLQVITADGEVFEPTEKEQKVVNDTVFLFRQTQASRDRNFQYFDGLNLIEYINDSVRRFNTNIDEREGIEDWQAGVHDPFTRNKVLGILGRVLEVLPIASFSSRGEENPIKGEILTDIYHFAEEVDEYDELMIHILLEAIVKGTAIGYEDIEYCEKTRREVDGIGDDMTVTEKKYRNIKMIGSIVPLEEFYPSSVSIRKVSKMPFCFWRKVITHSSFVEVYGHYARSRRVSGKQTYTENQYRPYYDDLIDSNVPDGSVELIKFYDKVNDQFIIIANGIWLNPIGNEDIMPLPWAHKELPFWDIKYDIFGDFFYGKGLPDRLKSMQDVLNVLTNMLLDQSFLTIFPPLLTSGMDDIEDDYLRPGRRTPVDTQGMPLANAFQVLESPVPQGWHQFILQYTRSVMEESSMDKVSQGVAGQGDRTTAYEIRTAAAGVTAMLQLFARFINQGIKRKAKLKATNILQYGMDPDAPMLESLLKNKYAEMGMFQSFTRTNSKLPNGKRGTRVIEMYGDSSQVPSKKTNKLRAALASEESGVPFEIISIAPEYMRNLEFDVSIVTDPRNEKTKQNQQMAQVEKARLYSELFGDLVDRQELASITMEKFGDDPEKLLKQEETPMPGQMPGMETGGMGNQGRSLGTENPSAALEAIMTM